MDGDGAFPRSPILSLGAIIALLAAQPVAAQEYSPVVRLAQPASTSVLAAGMEKPECSENLAGGCQACDTVCCECCCPRWIATADAMFLWRHNRDVDLTFTDEFATQILTGVDQHEFGVGPRLGLIDNCRCLELQYFGVDEWSDWWTLPAAAPPGTFVQFPGAIVPVLGDISFQYGSELHSTEFNVRRASDDGRLTWLAGFRWLELHEDFAAFSSVSGALYTIDTGNHLYGGQVGAEMTLWDCGGPLRIDGWAKAGVYYNTADQTTVGIFPGPAVASAEEDQTAFVGELSLVSVYDLSPRWALRAGYQALWLEQVALAPNQLATTDLSVPFALIDTERGLFVHGVFLGLQGSF